MGFLHGATEYPDYSKNQEVPISKDLGLEICIVSLLWYCINQRNSRTSQDSRRGAMDLTCHLLVTSVKMYDKHYSPFCDHRLLSFLSLVKYTLSFQIPKCIIPYSTRLRLSSRVSLSAPQSLSLSPIAPSVWALILIRMEYHHTFFFQINFKKANTSCSLDFGLHL